MKKSDFHYELPDELVAQQPLAERSASRLLVVPPAPGAFEDRMVRDLPGLLRAGDLLVFNDTRVLPARLRGAKDSGGRVEILVERVLSAHEARVQMGSSKPGRPGQRIAIDGGAAATVVEREGEFYRLRFDGPECVEQVLLRIGRLPLPPYIRREAGEDDLERYQTLFAREQGAVAAPTAGLHFDQPLLDALAAAGIDTATVTLHVGAGTFQPMRVERVDEHQMHEEWLNVGAGLCERIARTRAAGGRIIAVGTTVVRALETAWRDGRVQPFAGETRLFLFPGRRVRSVDAMVTNFHLPESTLMMLVAAFAGRERILAAYRHAVGQRYRFFSYGDAMLLWPSPDGQGA